MFGKPIWFRETKGGWGLMPVCWQGWCCTLAWLILLLVPYWVLAANGRGPESLVWVAVIAACWWWEMRQLRTSSRCSAGGDEVLYIGDEADSDQLATRNYNFRLRQ